MVHYGPVGKSEHQRVIGEWELARASMRSGQKTQELDARAAWLGQCLSIPEHPRSLGEWREGGCTVWSLQLLCPLGCWLLKDRVGVGTQRSGLSGRSCGGMGLWVWER